ncbi:hypothetical protein O181_132222 [Austropuccinia psidii MF-1]|uniref:Uncharacterized protein n=1 Tax=Austropuccinia psidii MF-1 TaxID=1389203 RepID=A0A9Q3QDS1_9BASI|nr:hypothetical protein [Austropuccinia psidii MF-1]
MEISLLGQEFVKPGLETLWSPKMVPKVSREDKKPEIPVLQLNKCGSISYLANTCIKKTKINEVQVIEEAQYAEDKEESDQDSSFSEDTTVEDYSIENIAALVELTEVHTHSPQYSPDFHCMIVSLHSCTGLPATPSPTPISLFLELLGSNLKSKVQFYHFKY